VPARVVGIKVVAAVALALALPATASAVADFKSPRGAAYCGISHGEPPFHLICWTPNDGFTVAMGARSRPGKSYNPNNRGYHDAVGRTLRFGQRWARVGFYCVSRRTGLTCTNRVGHGWWLGRYRGYRLF
jgi:hypothetical protein